MGVGGRGKREEGRGDENYLFDNPEVKKNRRRAFAMSGSLLSFLGCANAVCDFRFEFHFNRIKKFMYLCTGKDKPKKREI